MYMTEPEFKGQARLDCLALTISPPDSKLSLKDTWLKHLRRIALIESRFILYPETDRKGRLHYHGIIWKDKFYKESIEKCEKMGFIKLVEITSLEGWYKYCKKEIKITKSMLELPKKFKCIDHEYVSKYKLESTSRNILSYFFN